MTELIAQIKEAEENYKKVVEQRDLLIVELKEVQTFYKWMLVHVKMDNTHKDAIKIMEIRIKDALKKVGVK
jgi:hypothetical protein